MPWDTEIGTRLTLRSIGKPVLTTASYPDDFDTTSLAFMVMDCDKEVVSSVMDEMLEYVSDEGIIMVCNTSAPL